MCIEITPVIKPGEAMLPPAAADHHLHIQGPDISAELQRSAARTPARFSMISPELLKPHTASDAIKVLDQAGIGQGALLSQAYSFSSAFATAGLDVDTLTRRENRYNVEAAINSGGRLKAFIGVNPFAENAATELRYWRGREGVTGVKLHLSNSGFNPDEPAQLSRLAAFFDLVSDAKLPMIIHTANGKSGAAASANLFVQKILPHAKEVTVQIAHGGGGGGLDDPTIAALSVYAEAIEKNSPGTSNLLFDLSVVLVRDASEPDSAGLLQNFVDLVRRIGISRFLIGSDWPSLLPPDAHNKALESQMPFTIPEWHALLKNRASYLN